MGGGAQGGGEGRGRWAVCATLPQHEPVELPNCTCKWCCVKKAAAALTFAAKQLPLVLVLVLLLSCPAFAF
jgi:hypothetical protein